jgi:hypothetical protein
MKPRDCLAVSLSVRLLDSTKLLQCCYDEHQTLVDVNNHWNGMCCRFCNFSGVTQTLYDFQIQLWKHLVSDFKSIGSPRTRQYLAFTAPMLYLP